MIVRVLHHHEGSRWWAESPDVDGWTAAAETFEELRSLSEDGVRFALGRDDLDIEHFVGEPGRSAA